MTHTIFYAVSPGAAIRLGTKLPLVGALSMPFVFLEISLVLTRAIEPPELTLAVLFVIFPRSFILDTIWPEVDSITIDVVSFELSFEDTSIRAGKLTVARFLSINIVANIARLVWKSFSTFAMWLLVQPLAFVICSIKIATDTLSA